MQGLSVIGSRFFWRLGASYTAVLVVTAAIIVLLVDRRLSEGLAQDLEQRLRNECELVTPLAARCFRGEVGAEIQPELVAVGRASGVRVTLVGHDGRVLADSHEDPSRMENHSERPEIRQAYEEEYGVRSRISRTVGFPMLYVARVLRSEGEPLGVVRVSLSVEAVESRLSSARDSVVLGAAVGLLVAIGLGFYVARRITRPIADVTRVAEELREGRYESRVSVTSQDEIGLLGDTMNRLGREITARIAHMTREDSRLRAMLAGMVEGVIAVDDRDVIAFCNDAAQRLLGIDAQATAGKRLWELVRVAGLEELLGEARSGRTVTHRELVLHGGDRDQVLEAHAAPFLSEVDGAHGLVVVLHDVTDLRRLERIRRDFVANVSHELKTPLTSIKGFVDTLLEGALDDDENRERFVRRIDENVGRIVHLVTDLLSLARIESQGEAVPRDAVDLGEILRRVSSGHREVAREKGLALTLEETDGSVIVLGDAEALTQVVGNLLENAIRYTSEGQVRVTLGQEAGRGVLHIEDTGVGIPDQDLERVFERFYRVDKARSRELGGTGLGLSIVRNLVQTMGGEVSVQSRVGEGSRFTVELPLAHRTGS